MDLDAVRTDLLDTPERLRTQVADVLTTLVLPTWGTERHGYERLLYGAVFSAVALADRLSVYLWPDLLDGRKQTKRLQMLFQEMTPDPLAASVAVQVWRHTLTHFGDPVVVSDPRNGARYSWLVQWGPDHLPRPQHLAFAEVEPGHLVLAFGVQYLIDDVATLGAELMTKAERDSGLAKRLASTRAQLVARQRINVRMAAATR